MFLKTGWQLPVLVFLLWCVVSAPVRAQVPDLPLANVYRQGMPLEGYWVSEKYDGVRAYWDGRQLVSRSGHQYRAPEWFTEGFPDQPLDGELWMGRGRFAELSGAVRKAKPDPEEWRQIRFMVFDLPVEGLSFDQRLEQLQSLVAELDSGFIEVVPQHRATSHEALMAELDSVVAAGGEGLMLRRGASEYQGGRSDDLVKVKPYLDAEARVVRHLPGKGRYEGMLGALEVELANGRRFRIGTGFSDDERASPPAIGSVITFRYSGLTATGLPRFASFLRVRNDEPPEGVGQASGDRP